jgi:hypothetical protein
VVRTELGDRTEWGGQNRVGWSEQSGVVRKKWGGQKKVGWSEESRVVRTD